MATGESEMAVFEYRLQQSDTFRGVRKEQRDQGHELEALRERVSQHTEQISGDGGLQKSMRALREELGAIRTALYALTGTLILATVALATAVATHAL